MHAIRISSMLVIMVTLIDNKGHSPHTPTHTIQNLADDLYEYLQYARLLDPLQKLVLIGHSMGGMALM